MRRVRGAACPSQPHGRSRRSTFPLTAVSWTLNARDSEIAASKNTRRFHSREVGRCGSRRAVLDGSTRGSHRLHQPCGFEQAFAFRHTTPRSVFRFREFAFPYRKYTAMGRWRACSHEGLHSKAWPDVPAYLDPPTGYSEKSTRPTRGVGMDAVEYTLPRRAPNCRQKERDQCAGSPGGSPFYLQNDIFLEWAMLGSNQRPLPFEVCKAYSNAFYYTGAFRILMPISPFRGSMFSYRLLVFSAQVAARLQQAPPFRQLMT